MQFNPISAVVLTILILTSGCATPVNKELVPTGGSRADATVELSYEHLGKEQPVIDQAQGLATAKQRCAAWGYKSAEPFGGEQRKCQRANEYGCARWFVTVKYQCLG